MLSLWSPRAHPSRRRQHAHAVCSCARDEDALTERLTPLVIARELGALPAYKPYLRISFWIIWRDTSAMAAARVTLPLLRSSTRLR
jgi:hypothetical protein